MQSLGHGYAAAAAAAGYSILYTSPRTWHQHIYDHTPKKPTPHSMVDILGLGGDEGGQHGSRYAVHTPPHAGGGCGEHAGERGHDPPGSPDVYNSSLTSHVTHRPHNGIAAALMPDIQHHLAVKRETSPGPHGYHSKTETSRVGPMSPRINVTDMDPETGAGML